MDCYLNFNNYIKDLYHTTTIYWNFPLPENYDALVVSHIWSKKWFNGINVRDKIVRCFQLLRKPIFCLKIDTTLEHRHIKLSSEDYIYYGVNNLTELSLPERWGLPETANKFIFPQLCKLNIPKLEETILSKKGFYKKYNINKRHKIITFFIGRFKKWHGKTTFTPNICELFMENYNDIDNYLHQKGYQVILKLHRCDGEEIQKKYKLNNLIVIDNNDGYEATLYSSKAFTAYSTVLFELYLYDLPTLDLGNGIYYPGWISQLSRGGIKKLKNNSPFKELDYGRDLLYGMVLNPDKNITLEEFKQGVSQFLDKTFSIKNYRYLDNHPVYGDSYYNDIKDITNEFVLFVKKTEIINKKKDRALKPSDKKRMLIISKKFGHFITNSNKIYFLL